MKRLRANSRQYVEATVRDHGRTYPSVGIRLKGSSGSFQSLDDKPSFTLSFDRFDSGARFHGLRKIHLNNSVEDPSYVNELIGGEMFRAAGVPAPRVSHARVVLNGRPLGLYVLKEGFTEDLARLNFRRADGVWSDEDAGIDPDREDRSPAVVSTSEIARARDMRWKCLEDEFDMDRFMSFMAMEIMICHRDGYCFARNNFRIYQDPETSRKVFVPHGMDQLFGKADLPWRPNLAGNVARSVMESPAGREAYRSRFAELFTELFIVERLTNRVNQIVAELSPFLDDDEMEAIEIESTAVRDRIVGRAAFLEQRLKEPDPLPTEFRDGVAGVNGWVRVDVPRGGRLAEIIAADGVSALEILAGPETSASWRASARLKRGRYRFEGSGRVSGFKPLPYGRNQGAALRIAGRSQRSVPLRNDPGWARLEVEFEVDHVEDDVEFVCEFRASAGTAWFDRNLMRLVKVQ